MWVAISSGDEATHIIPQDDLIDHTLDPECVCGPEISDLGNGRWLYTHSSLDGREWNTPDWPGLS